MDEYIRLAALAALLQIAPGTVKNRRRLRPWAVPPDCTPPGTRPLVWHRPSVVDWMARQGASAAEPPTRPGRPPKGVRRA